VTARNRRPSIALPPAFSAAEIGTIRRQFGWSQAAFAAALNVSLATVRHWEQGLRVPDGGHARLLQIVARSPEVLGEAIGTDGGVGDAGAQSRGESRSIDG
jgi:DNA-binding transcriptional regulator YiaG